MRTFVKSIQPDAKLSSDWLSGRKYVAPLLLISHYRPQSLKVLTNSLGSRLKTQSSESLTVAKQSFLGVILALGWLDRPTVILHALRHTSLAVVRYRNWNLHVLTHTSFRVAGYCSKHHLAWLDTLIRAVIILSLFCLSLCPI